MHLTYEECLSRYPRLVRAIQRMAVFSSGEAACAIRDYRDGKAAARGLSPFESASIAGERLTAWGLDMLRYGGGEAVAHFGGPERVITRAIQFRNR